MKLLIVLLFARLTLAATIPNIALKDQDGKDFHIHDLKGNYVFLSFIYSRCPVQDMCPKAMKMSRQVHNVWARKNADLKLKILALSFDPTYDKPEVLKQYAKTFKLDQNDFILATGKQKEIDSFVEQFNIIAFPSAGQPLAHNMKSVLISPSLEEIAQYKDNEYKIDRVIEDARNYAKAKP